MAIVDADSERKHRKRGRRGTSDTKRRHHGRTDDAPSCTIADEAFDRPTDLPALREARLKSMAVPTAAREKMKIEYGYSKPRKTSATVRIKSAKSESRVAEKSSTVAKKSRKSSSTSRHGRNDDDHQYVYKTTNTSEVLRRDFQKEHDEKTSTDRKTSMRRKSVDSAIGKPQLARRRTEPVSTMSRASTTSDTRPQLRKGATSVHVGQIVSEEPSGKPRARDSIVSAVATKTTKSQRNSSLLGSLFTKSSPKPEKLVSCLTCGSDDVPVSKAARLPCTHRMCHSCLKRIFKMSIKDPAHMPPRCCTEQHIDLKHVESLFDIEFKKTWNHKFKEYNAKNRIYCPRKGCGEWIQPKHMRTENGRKFGVCPKCKHAVCPTCNQKAHRSRECPKDPAIKQLNEIAEQEGWRKCYNCSAMVELKEGCNHMTCRCLAEFCMVCGLKWKSCDCPWFNYDAVDDLQGNPVRYQQELDRRREQERRDEEMARQMAGLGLGRRNRNRHQPIIDDPVDLVEVGNAAPNHLNVNFLQQARDALTANYQHAELAARGLLGGWLTGTDNVLPAGLPGTLEDETQRLQRQPTVPEDSQARRRTYHQYRLRPTSANRHTVN